MRIITQGATRHNQTTRRRTLRAGLTMVLAGLVLTGCSGDSVQEQAGPQEQSSPTCSVLTDAGAWTAFTELADRITRQGEVPRQDLDAFGSLPTVTHWRNSMAPQVPPVERVGNWLEGTFWTELGRRGPQKVNADRTEFGRSYRYSLTQRDIIDQRIRELSGPRKCDLQTQAEFWIEPANLPDTLTVYFLPAKAEIRIFADVLLVDTGVVAAGPPDQIIRQMTSLLYRNYQYLTGPNPAELSGAAAVAQVFRILMNEGLAGWIDRTVATEFAPDHPTLARFQVIPERYFTTAQKAINLLNRHLGPMLDDEAAMTAKANSLVMTLGTMNAYNQAGYAMAAVIAARLGESRLRDSGRSVPAFVAAYQEAASQNPVPVPAPGARGVELHQTVPALEPEVHAKLQSLLLEHFPE